MRLSTKVLLLVGTASVLGFGTLVLITTVNESRELLAAHRARSEMLATSVATGIQNIMLTGKGVLAEELVQDSRELPGVWALKVYDRHGFEVYLPREKRTGDLNAAAADVLLQGVEVRRDGGLVKPLANEEACTRCHDEEGQWRGAIGIELADTAASKLVYRFAETALKNVMVSGEADEITGFLVALQNLSYVNAAFVIDNEGGMRFGAEGDLRPALVEPVATLLKDGGRKQVEGMHLFAVPNEESCHVCHSDDHDYRGVIAVGLNPIAADKLVDVAAELFEKSLMQLMLSDRGNQLDTYLSELRSADVIRTASLFDADGVEVYPPALDAQKQVRGAKTQDTRVLKSLEDAESRGFEEGDFYTEVVPLENEVRCQACHGSDHPVRATLAVQTDLRPAKAAIRANRVRASVVLIIFVVASSVLLYAVFRRLFVQPVIRISEVAHEVGLGNLDVRVDHTSNDEVGRLANEINEMIMGLQSKLIMERFVGDHTRRMIDESVRGAGHTGAPIRREIAVLFSDVRGFTSYSERTEPERVIETLNVYLGLQAEVIERHGGYVDKFVGDEVMALFEGPDKELRAARAALEMLEVVAGAPEVDRMQIGVGVNCGDVVFGSTGSAERQDYTVIGDTVNLAARLCSAAAADVILVTEEARERIGDALTFRDARELQVKGKMAPVRVYEVLAEAQSGSVTASPPADADTLS